MTRAVLDPNVIVSAALSPNGIPAQCIRAHVDGRYELVVSPLLLEELRRVLHNRRLRRYISVEDADRVLDGIDRTGTLVDDPVERERVSRDKTDDYLIALARASHSHVLVTGERDLLALDLADLAIVSPREFLERLPP